MGMIMIMIIDNENDNAGRNVGTVASVTAVATITTITQSVAKRALGCELCKFAFQAHRSVCDCNIMAISLHPLLRCLHGILQSEKQCLKAVMDIAMFSWCATYIVTDAEQLVVKLIKHKRKSTLQSFTASHDNSSLVYFLAKLRSDLADASSITFSEANVLRCSPLLVVDDGLDSLVLGLNDVQVVGEVDVISVQSIVGLGNLSDGFLEICVLTLKV